MIVVLFPSILKSIVPSSTLTLDTVQLYTPVDLCLIVTVTSVSVGGSLSKISHDTLMFSMGSSLTLQLTVVAGALDTLKERVNCGGSASRGEVRENWTGELTTGPAGRVETTVVHQSSNKLTTTVVCACLVHSNY